VRILGAEEIIDQETVVEIVEEAVVQLGGRKGFRSQGRKKKRSNRVPQIGTGIETEMGTGREIETEMGTGRKKGALQNGGADTLLLLPPHLHHQVGVVVNHSGFFYLFVSVINNGN